MRELIGTGEGEPFLEDADCETQSQGSMKSPYLKTVEVGGESCSGRSEAGSQEGSGDYQESAPWTLLRLHGWEGRG